MKPRLLSVAGTALSALALGACGVAATHQVEATPSSAPRSGVVQTTTADGSIVRLRAGGVFAVLNGDASRWVGDTVSVVSNERIMLNHARHDRAEVTYVGDAANPRTYSNTGEHTQESGAADGSLLLLDDGSVWVVPTTGRSHTYTWTEGSVVNVEPGPGGLYKLANPSSGTSVLAAYVGEK